MFLLPLFFFLLLVNVPAQANDAPDTPAIADIISGDEIKLTDGHLLYLAGVKTPLAQTKEWQKKARQVLRDLTAGRRPFLEDGITDRYGRMAAQVYAVDAQNNKIWLQGEMLKRGLVFLYPPTGFEARLDEMRALEAAARQAKTGIWSDNAYSDALADQPFAREGSFAFIRGTVIKALRAKNMVYIHFGEDWRTSFTLAIAAHDLHNFRKPGIDPLALAGKNLRARGWVKHNIGPMIEITDPGQIELLAP